MKQLQSQLKSSISLDVLAALPAAQVTSCEGCGACCTEQALPPFMDEIDLIPLDLQREVQAALAIEQELIAAGRPCIWFDEQTRKCRHYEHRPNVCREFETGGDCCLETRAKTGL